MADLYHDVEEKQYIYYNKEFAEKQRYSDHVKLLENSRTVYVGNLSFVTSEIQIHECFSVAGTVKRVIMGVNAQTKMPCGFCFVEYYTRESTLAALKYISGTMLDTQIIRCELDPGFYPGRQYGRGKKGGQTRDERKNNELNTNNFSYNRGHTGQRGHGGGGNRNSFSSAPKPDSYGRDRGSIISGPMSENSRTVTIVQANADIGKNSTSSRNDSESSSDSLSKRQKME